MAPKASIASLSLGRAWVHPLEAKLDQAAAHNFAGIELFYEDLEYLAKIIPGGPTQSNLLHVAAQIRSMCTSRGLTIICLQPFMHYEGLLDASEHAKRVADFQFWLILCKTLGTDLIVVPSTFLTEGVTGDRTVLVSDMREIADLAAQQQPVVRIAYEALCWGTFINTWDDAYELVCDVDRANFGTCLDAFNICGRVFADPSAQDGRMPSAEQSLKASLERMKNVMDVKKIFLVQVADAEKMREPLVVGHSFHIDGQPTKMSWSRNARLFPGEEKKGAYLPVLDVLGAITGEGGLGYDGWISSEIFSRTLMDPRPEAIEEHAARAEISWGWMKGELGWEQEHAIEKVNSRFEDSSLGSFGSLRYIYRSIKGTFGA
jgi:4-hydroxyphenylpyruvate dioxygenase